MTSKDENDKPILKKVKSKNKLKGGDPNENSIQGGVFVEQAFSSQYVTEFIEIIKKDSKIQNDLSQTIEKYNKESYLAQSGTGQNALIQNKVFEQAINITGDTTEDLDIEIEQN